MGMTDNVPVPVSEPVRKILRDGLDLKFQFQSNKIFKAQADTWNPAGQITARVVVRPTSDWAESIDAQDKMVATALLGEGLIIGCELTPRDYDDGWGHQGTEPEDIVIFGRFRNAFVHWLERRNWLQGGAMTYMGNGAFEMSLATEIDGHDARIRVRVDRDPNC